MLGHQLLVGLGDGEKLRFELCGLLGGEGRRGLGVGMHLACKTMVRRFDVRARCIGFESERSIAVLQSHVKFLTQKDGKIQ